MKTSKKQQFGMGFAFLADSRYKQIMLWIIGPVFKDFHDYLVGNAIPYGVFYDEHRPLKFKPEHSLKLDFSSRERLHQAVQSLPEDITTNVGALLVAGYEQYVVPAAQLAAYFGVAGPSLDSAKAATNKLIMRQRFMDHNPGITPAFGIVNDWEDIANFVTTHGLPVVLKPASLMKSLYVSKNYTLEELKRNYQIIAAALPAMYAELPANQTPEIIIEEFLDGTMHTVAGSVDAAGVITLAEAIVDCLPAPGSAQQESYVYRRQLPSSLEASQQAAILAVAREGVMALGLTASMLHIELILTAEGPKLIEIGARIGGYRARMYQQACGIDLYQSAIAIARGEQASLTGSPKMYQAVFELFPAHEGQFVALTNQDLIEQSASFSYLSIKRQPGELIGTASNGYRATAVLILSNVDNGQFQKDVALAAQKLTISVV